MTIHKQDFYEGAALQLLVRGGGVQAIRYEKPFYIVNDVVTVYLKYSTKGRSPWGFTFGPREHALLSERSLHGDLVLGLVCGHDGVACIDVAAYHDLSSDSERSFRISCSRKHGQHYSVAGPAGVLLHKVSPSLWQRFFLGGVANEAL